MGQAGGQAGAPSRPPSRASSLEGWPLGGEVPWGPSLEGGQAPGPRETEEGGGKAWPLPHPGPSLQPGPGRPQPVLPRPGQGPPPHCLSPGWPGIQCLRPHLPALLPTLLLGGKSRRRGEAGAALPPPVDSGPNQSCFPQSRRGGGGEGPPDSPVTSQEAPGQTTSGAAHGERRMGPRNEPSDVGQTDRWGRDPQRLQPERDARMATHPKSRSYERVEQHAVGRRGSCSRPGHSRAQEAEGTSGQQGTGSEGLSSNQAHSQPHLLAGLIIPRPADHTPMLTWFLTSTELGPGQRGASQRSLTMQLDPLKSSREDPYPHTQGHPLSIPLAGARTLILSALIPFPKPTQETPIHPLKPIYNITSSLKPP